MAHVDYFHGLIAGAGEAMEHGRKGTVAAFLFAITAARIFLGEQLLPTSAPLPSLGYPFLVLTFGGFGQDFKLRDR